MAADNPVLKPGRKHRAHRVSCVVRHWELPRRQDRDYHWPSSGLQFLALSKNKKWLDPRGHPLRPRIPGGTMVTAKLRAFLLITLLAAGAATAQSKRPALKAEDIFNLQTASDPQISPDGQRIVYVRGFADIMTDRRHANLWIINADGTNHRPLTSGVSNDSSPRWSPDGTRIAYISGEDGRSQIFVRWMDTGQTARITALESAPSGIEWSPDGKQISFTTFVPSEPIKLAQMPKMPPGAEGAAPPVIYDKPVYRFNAAGYLKPGYTHVFVVSAEGGTPRQITNGSFHFGGPG